MQIPLQEFELHIDETILQRGLTYFKKGRVNEPEEISSGHYEVIVQGTKNYMVRLNLKNETITEYSCDCPYDLGPVCKHITAVIFYMQQEELGIQKNADLKKSKPKPPKKKNITQRVDEILEKLSHDELKQFIKYQASSDTSFKGMLLSSFAHLDKNESKKVYTRQLKAILKTAADRSGFIDWRAVRSVGNAVRNLLETAQNHAKNGNYKSAMLISFAVLEEMTEALQFSDDSHDELGSNIHMAYNLLVDICSEKLSEESRKQLFDYTISSFEEKVFFGWEWHLGMIKIASMIFDNEDELKKIISLLDHVERREFDYEFEKAQTIKLQLLKKTRGEDEADKFMEQNIDNPSLRKVAIQKALLKKDYDKAISIAKDGVKFDSKKRPGLAMDWNECLLNIAIEQQDTEKIIEYARLLFVSSIKEKQQYYTLLKNVVDQKQWGNFVEELISDIKKKNLWLNIDLLATIYINEGSWKDLLSFLEQEMTHGFISIENVKQYETHLAKKYPKELAKLYEQGIIEIMENNAGRSHYKNACRYIRRMIKIGAKAEADKLIESLRKTYPQRRALMEELGRI
jgi:uncharacterized Zn finger protein